MSTQLPQRPDLRHLKDQARDLVKSGKAASLADAQFQIARQYGFASWPKLKAHVDSLVGSLKVIGQLKDAIDANDLDGVRSLMTQHPDLHRAPVGYGKNGPLTWAAECRGPASPPSAARLAIAAWMLDNGSDIHQGGDMPLMRASLFGTRIAMMELLVARGADVNGRCGGRFPILLAPCETVEPVALQWLLDHGADANRAGALDYLIGGYARSAQLPGCIDILTGAGAKTKYDHPAVMAILRGKTAELAVLLGADPGLVEQRFADLDIGATGARRLTLKGATLLHVAAEFGNAEIARLLLDRGADVNARATVDAAGVGGQTPIFHAVTQFGDFGMAAARLLLTRGADRTVRARLPGHYERADEIVDCTPLDYARLFPDGPPKQSPCAALLQ